MTGVLLLLSILADATPAHRPAHRGIVYSCMRIAPGDEPWIDADVPFSLEHAHAGWSIQRFRRYRLAGLALFEIIGRRPARRVVGVDAAGREVAGKELFDRSRAGITRPGELARRALETLSHHAQAEILSPARLLGVAPEWRARVTAPALDGRSLTFWVRATPEAVVPTRVHVDLERRVLYGLF
jgi:hypothetical protein